VGISVCTIGLHWTPPVLSSQPNRVIK